MKFNNLETIKAGMKQKTNKGVQARQTNSRT